MTIERVKSMFTLFTGQKDYETYLPIISVSMFQVEKMLKEGANFSDPRLDILAGSVANYRYVQILSAQMETVSAYNGEMVVSDKNTGALKYAEGLMRDYMSMCSDLIGEQSAVFIATGGKDGYD